MTSRILHPDYRAVILSEAAYGGLPAGYWPLDEVSGTTAVDVMTLARGSSNNATYTGGVALGGAGFISGTNGRAATFDGSTGLLNVGTLGSFGTGLGNGFAIECWLQSTATGRVCLFGIDDGTLQISIIVNGDYTNGTVTAGRMSINIRPANNGIEWVSSIVSSCNIADGNQHHCVFVFDTPGHTSAVWIDGVKQSSSDTYNAASYSSAFSVNAYFAAYNFENSTTFNIMPVKLAHAVIWPYVLDPTRILYHYLAGINGIYSGAIAA